MLRLGGVLCFVGHGAFGVMTKESWVPYFALFGIGREVAFQLMPVIGWMDIAMGLSLLVTMRPALLAWMVVWTVFTAALRPMAGEPAWEMLERAGNYGVTLALLLLVWPQGDWRSWFAEASVDGRDGALRRSRRALMMTCALLLLGHGALALGAKPALVRNLAAAFPAHAAAWTPPMGGFEVALAGAVLVLPTLPLTLLIAIWKLATESLFLVAGAPFWEVVERGGSYVVPLALAWIAVRGASGIGGDAARP